MPNIDINFNEPAWPEIRELPDDQVVHIVGGDVGITILPGGMASGEPSVAFKIMLPDGKVLLWETSWAILSSTVGALQGRLDYLRDGGE